MEFSEQHGHIVVGRRGINTVEGLYCVLCGAACELERILSDAGMPKPEGMVREALTNKLFQFWLACAYEVIQEEYSGTEAALVIQTLCARCFRGRFPDVEVILVGRLSDSERGNLAEFAEDMGAPPIYRLFQLIDRLPGGKSIASFEVTILLKPFLVDMFLRDCNTVLSATEPDKVGRELMNSFSHRFEAIETAVWSKLSFPPATEL